MGATFVDIGANVGNHSLFAATFLNAARVVPVEPNPRCLRLMLLTAISVATVFAVMAGMYPVWRVSRLAPAGILKTQ